MSGCIIDNKRCGFIDLIGEIINAGNDNGSCHTPVKDKRVKLTVSIDKSQYIETLAFRTRYFNRFICRLPCIRSAGF